MVLFTRCGRFYYFFKFINFEREREQVKEEQEERERERIPNRLHTVSIQPNVGLKVTNHEIMI